MAGAFADWFAVSALFRPIYIPLVCRRVFIPHTDIIASNRGRITDGIADMVQNHWLSPESIKERLNDVNFSSQVLNWLKEASNEDTVLDLWDEVIEQLVTEIDSAEVAYFLEAILKAEIKDLDIEASIGAVLVKALDRGDHADAWVALCKMIEKTARSVEIRHIIVDKLRQAVDRYASEDRRKAIGVRIAEWRGILDVQVVVDKLLEQITDYIQEVQTNPQNPLREKLDSAVYQWARGLQSGTPEAKASFAQMRSALMQNLEVADIIQKMLRRFKATVLEQLRITESPFNAMSRRYLHRFIDDFRESQDNQMKLNEWVWHHVSGIVQHPKFQEHIGATVRSSIGKLDNRSLVEQIQDKVGEDLQYI